MVIVLLLPLPLPLPCLHAQPHLFGTCAMSACPESSVQLPRLACREASTYGVGTCRYTVLHSWPTKLAASRAVTHTVFRSSGLYGVQLIPFFKPPPPPRSQKRETTHTRCADSAFARERRGCAAYYRCILMQPMRAPQWDPDKPATDVRGDGTCARQRCAHLSV